MPEESLLQLGAMGIILLFTIRELFAYLKAKKQGEQNGNNEVMESMLKELRTMNENHLHSLKDAINTGNDRIVEAINNGNLKQVELLGRIEGKLDRR